MSTTTPSRSSCPPAAEAIKAREAVAGPGDLATLEDMAEDTWGEAPSESTSHQQTLILDSVLCIAIYVLTPFFSCRVPL